MHLYDGLQKSERDKNKKMSYLDDGVCSVDYLQKVLAISVCMGFELLNLIPWPEEGKE